MQDSSESLDFIDFILSSIDEDMKDMRQLDTEERVLKVICHDGGGDMNTHPLHN